MDFTYSEEQEAVRQLAAQIFSDRSTHERLKEIEAAAGDEGPIDRELWAELARRRPAGHPSRRGRRWCGPRLRGRLPGGRGGRPHRGLRAGRRDHGLRRRAHRRVRHRRPAQAWLPGVASGDTILTAALAELVGEVILPGGDRARHHGDGAARRRGCSTGTKACVPAALVADAMLVPATCRRRTAPSTAVGVFIVDPAPTGSTLTRADDDDGPTEAIARARRRARSGPTGSWATAPTAPRSIDRHHRVRDDRAVRQEAGVCAAALELTAEYTKTRVQFDKPIATFQAVGQRAADAYVDTEAIRLTAWQAASRLAAGLPAAAEVAVAKYWAAEGGQRVVHAARTSTAASGSTATTRCTATSC